MKYLSLLKKLAAKSDHTQHQMSCIIVKRNRILGKGYNQQKTDPNSPHKFKHVHSEWNALSGLSIKETKNCTVYIYRENKNGILSNAKPCPSCTLFLQKMQIWRTIYSYDNSWKVEVF